MSDKTRRKGSFADGVFSIAATLLIIDVSVSACGGRAGSRDRPPHGPAYAATGLPKASVTLFAAIVFYVLESSLFGRSA